MGRQAHKLMSMSEVRQRSSAYNPYEGSEEDTEFKDHPKQPVKQMGMGMMLGRAIAGIFILGFIYYIEEERVRPDWELHSKVVEHHRKKKESHAILTKLHQDIKDKHARGELPVHEPTEEELENRRIAENLRAMDWEGDGHEDAPGMINAFGEQMEDSKHDLEHRLKEFWRLDKNKDAFLTKEIDFLHLAKIPVNLVPEEFDKLDTNKDNAIGIREFCAGFHDQAHIKEPWYHHKYGYVYGHDIPDHVSKARPGAVKKGTEEHKAAKAGVHPAQTQKKLDKKKRDVEMKELNQKAHEANEAEHERQEKSPHYMGHDDEEPSARL